MDNHVTHVHFPSILKCTVKAILLFSDGHICINLEGFYCMCVYLKIEYIFKSIHSYGFKNITHSKIYIFHKMKI